MKNLIKHEDHIDNVVYSLSLTVFLSITLTVANPNLFSLLNITGAFHY